MGQQGIYAAPNLDIANRDRECSNQTGKLLLEAAKTLMKLLAEQYGPHSIVMVSSTDIELYEGKCRESTNIFIQD